LYAFRRYATLDDCPAGWDDSKDFSENIKAFDWCPGMRFRPERADKLVKALIDCNLEPTRAQEIVNALSDLHEWLRDGGCFARGVNPVNIDEKEIDNWHTAYNLQPDKPIPERL